MTKIHAEADARGLPIRLAITPGQDDAAAAAALLNPTGASWRA
jgi:hypothetical protein